MHTFIYSRFTCTYILDSHAHIYKYIVGSYAHTNIHHRLILHIYKPSRHTCHIYKHTVGTHSSHIQTDSRYTYITCTHLQTQSRLICTYKHIPQAHMHIYKHTVDTHTHTRFVGCQVCWSLQAPPSPSPSSGWYPFLSQPPSSSPLGGMGTDLLTEAAEGIGMVI